MKLTDASYVSHIATENIFKLELHLKLNQASSKLENLPISPKATPQIQHLT